MPRKRRATLAEDLKEAISSLSDQEKDKLLFRLIPKDPALVDRLTYQLLEDATTPERRRNTLRVEIEQQIEQSARHFYSPGYLLLDLRSISGDINRHVKTTRDKYGEIELNLFMLNHCLDILHPKLRSYGHQRSRTLDSYIVKRAQKLQKLIEKIHEDYQLDFAAGWEKLIQHVNALPNLKRMASLLDLEY